MNAPKNVIDAWRRAAEEIGFEFLSPFTLESEGKTVTFAGCVLGFGSKNGTVFLTNETFKENHSAFSRAAESHGFYFSCISESIYSKYVRSEFLDTLKDWGWHSTTLKPPQGFAPHIPTSKRRGKQ